MTWIIIQWVAAIFYLLNKICLSVAERKKFAGRIHIEDRWRKWAWITYLIGLPAWVIILGHEEDFIAAGIELSGAPSMVMGLLIARDGINRKQPQWIRVTEVIVMLIGLLVSLYSYGGITTFTQVLELGLSFGFLIGTYQLARKRPSGYVWYVLMHLCCASLMWMQDYPWLFAQQILSLAFIFDAYRMSNKIPPVVHLANTSR